MGYIPVIHRTEGAVEYGYYIVDVDGVTLATYGEGAPVWRMCNLEGESCPRYAEISIEGV